MVIGKSAPCSSSGIGALLVFESKSGFCLLAGRWLSLVPVVCGDFGFGDSVPEGSSGDGESIL